MRPGAVWRHRSCDDAVTAALTRELQIDPVIARLLVDRGLTTPETAHRFLNPTVDHLHDPFLMTDLPVGVDRLLAAVERGERIAVHGDYDVDGVTSTVILRRLIELLGGDVVHFIPERLRDGYGLQPEAIDRLHDRNVRVIISVDCGIRSQEAAARAKELGIDLVITDHHEPGASLPPALAVINPRRPDCAYPDKDLAGVGVTLKVAHALCLKTDRMRWLPGFLKLAAIGTVADMVPLRGENRVIAKLGLDRLTRGPHTIGLQALLDASGVSGKKDRKLRDRIHGGAAGQRGRTDEHARPRDTAVAGSRRGGPNRSDDPRRAARRRERAATSRGSGNPERCPASYCGRPRGRCPQHPGDMGRGLAPRRDRDRRLEAGRAVLPAGHRAVC